MTYIAPAAKVFDHLPTLHAWQRGEQPAPIALEVDLSNVCSLRCQGCHMAHTHTRGPWALAAVRPSGYTDTGTFADTKRTLFWLPQARQAGVQSITWSGGGEPTLHPDWRTIVDAAHGLGFSQGLYTLGGHLDEDAGRFLGERLTWAVVSLDAADADTYAREKGVTPARFEAACRGVRALVGGSAVVGVSFLLHAGNYSHLLAMLALSRSLGATYITFRPTIEVDQAQPNVLQGDRAWVTSALPALTWAAQQPDVECDPARFTEWAGWQGHGYQTCYGIRMSGAVTPDGRMWVCVNRRGLPDSCLGDLSTESFGAVWARHPKQWTVDSQCRAMCRLHPVNQTLAHVFAPRQHREFL